MHIGDEEFLLPAKDESAGTKTWLNLVIRVAISNPCFELWLLLHFTPHTAHAPTYKKLLPLLQKHVPGYDKTRVDFALYRDGRADAVTNAQVLDPTGQDHARNPSTGVWQLVERMEGR
nr:RloB family protein [Streptomyces sp. NBC_00886]